MGPKPLKTAPQTKPNELSQYKPGKHWVSDPDGEKEVLYAEAGVASKKGCPAKTLMDVFDLAAKKAGDKVAMRTENLNTFPKKGEAAPPALPLAQWKSWTWSQYIKDIRLVAKGFMSLGMEQHDSVNIFGFNSPEWLLSEMGAIYAGGKAAGIYPSDTAEQVQFKCEHSGTVVACVESADGLEKYKEVIDGLPKLKAVVCWSCEPGDDIKRSDGTVCKTMTFEDLKKLGAEYDNAKLDDRIKAVKPEQCCALIYTSGTTGKPKAVMISHDNIIFEGMSALPLSGIGKGGEERLVSYLPLSHVAGMLFDIISPVVITAYMDGYVSTNFARAYDLKLGTIGQRLAAVEPTVFLGVPRVWEKIMEKLLAIGKTTKGLKKKLSTTAKKKGLQYQTARQLGGNGKVPSFYGVYGILLKVIKGKLGLSKCKFACAGAAPMTKECLSYFGSLGINVNEVYGMSESCGATTFSTEEAHEWGSVGFELPGTEVKCFKVDAGGKKMECPRAPSIFGAAEEFQGELCYRGRHIMMGYMAQPALGDDHVATINEKNADAIDEEGWLHSGDKGVISKRGMIRITGRYKELIIGAGGENIAPVPIEDNMKKLCPFISNIMMYGDKRKFNVCLITLKCVGATGDLPGSNKLDGDAKQFGETIEDACKNEKLIKLVTKAIKDTGNDGECTPSNAAKIQKFCVLPIDFSVEGDELTATLKLKRGVVEKKYIDILEAMYEHKDAFVPYSTVGSYEVGNTRSGPSGSFKAAQPLTLDEDDVKAVEKEAKAAGAEDEEEE